MDVSSVYAQSLLPTSPQIQIHPAFLRRIHKVIYYKDMNEIIEYPTVQAYLERKSEFRTIEENEENPFE